jgi:uncharacterized protein (TIGR02246 family)
VLAISMKNSTAIRMPWPQLDDRQAIQRLNEEWISAVGKKDIPSLINRITEDVVFLLPGLPPICGKRAVQAMYADFFPQFSKVEQTSTLEEVEVAGDWAFAWGTERLVLMPKSGGAPIRVQGKGMSIFRRQPDGSWKFARGISNSGPQAP